MSSSTAATTAWRWKRSPGPLTHRAIAITGQERADILALADRVDELAATDGTRPTADLARAVITELAAT